MKQKPVIEMNVVSMRSQSTLSLIKVGGVVAGFIEKYHDTQTETHPYKAFGAIVGQGPVRVNTADMRTFATAAAALEHLKKNCR